MPNYITTQIITPKFFFPLGVTFDQTGNSGVQAANATYSFTHVVGAGGVNRLLVVAVSILSASDTVTSITYNGKNLIHLVAGDVTNVTTRSEIWYLTAPDTGSNTVTVNLSGSLASIANSESYESVDQIKPIDAVSTNSGIGNPVNATVTPVTNKTRVFGNLAIVSTSGITSAGGQSPRSNVSGSAGTSAADDKGIVDVAGATTITWNGAGVTDHWSSSIIAIRPFGTPNYASWVASTIYQPYFPALNINPYLIKPIDVGTYFKPPPAPVGAASWLSKSISQPTLPTPDINMFVWNPNAANLRNLIVVSTAKAPSMMMMGIGM